MPVTPLPGTRLLGAGDGTTWAPYKIDLGKGRILSIWVADLPANVDVSNVRVELGNMRLYPHYVGSHEPSHWQINVELPAGTATGNANVRISLGAWRSNSLSINVIGE
jgi:uncharacterized protein (TIGR03437 family)